MRILHIAPYLPSEKAVHAGGVCMAQEIETLRSLGHSVVCCSFYQQQYDAKCVINDKNCYLEKLTKLKKIIHCLQHPFTAPYFATRLSNSFFRRLVKIIKDRKIDAIHAEYAAMGLYIKLKKKFPYLKFNLILHDVTYQAYIRKFKKSHGLKRLLYIFNNKLIFKNEGYAVNNSDCVLTFCDKDSELVKKYYSPKQVRVINTYFGLDKMLAIDNSEEYHTKHGICFMGQMGRKENEEAAVRLIEIYNRIKDRLEGNKLYIFGSNPSEQLIKYSSDDVIICGYIEDVEKAMSKCRIAVFPLLSGAGIKIKVLTSLALGIPTITSNVGAEGIDETGKFLYLANSDQEFENSILYLITNEAECVRQSEIVKEFVHDNFSWDSTVWEFKVLYSA